MKTWKKIKEFSLYEVSSDGEIKTFNHYGKGKEAIMKPVLDNSGYLRTMLKGDDGKFHTIKLHRIVAINFIENNDLKKEVNHKNGIRSDNRVSNLEWVSRSENIKHSYNFLDRERKFGEKNHEATLTDKQVLEIRKNYVYGKNCKSGETKKQIAERYGTSFGVIKQIIQNRTWKHLL